MSCSGLGAHKEATVAGAEWARTKQGSPGQGGGRGRSAWDLAGHDKDSGFQPKCEAEPLKGFEQNCGVCVNRILLAAVQAALEGGGRRAKLITGSCAQCSVLSLF